MLAEVCAVIAAREMRAIAYERGALKISFAKMQGNRI
jgi:hypothetical protein